jgi:hypothetical protein
MVQPKVWRSRSRILRKHSQHTKYLWATCSRIFWNRPRKIFARDVTWLNLWWTLPVVFHTVYPSFVQVGVICSEPLFLCCTNFFPLDSPCQMLLRFVGAETSSWRPQIGGEAIQKTYSLWNWLLCLRASGCNSDSLHCFTFRCQSYKSGIDTEVQLISEHIFVSQMGAN